jgi:hypothetical protein
MGSARLRKRRFTPHSKTCRLPMALPDLAPASRPRAGLRGVAPLSLRSAVNCTLDARRVSSLRFCISSQWRHGARRRNATHHHWRAFAPRVSWPGCPQATECRSQGPRLRDTLSDTPLHRNPVLRCISPQPIPARLHHRDGCAEVGRSQAAPPTARGKPSRGSGPAFSARSIAYRRDRVSMPSFSREPLFRIRCT